MGRIREKGKDGFIVVFMDWEWNKEGWCCSTVCPMCLKRVLTEKEARRIARMGYYYGVGRVTEYLRKRKIPYIIYVEPIPKLKLSLDPVEVKVEKKLLWPIVFPLCRSCGHFLARYEKTNFIKEMEREVCANAGWLIRNLPERVYILFKDGTVVSPKSPYEYLDFLYGKKDLKRIKEW